MTTRYAALGGIFLALGCVAYGIALFPTLPALIPIHWDLWGRVNGWAPKQQVLILNPGLILLLVAMLVVLPAVSPRQFAVDRFRSTFNSMLLILAALIAYLHVVMLQAALHPQADSGRYLIGGVFFFFALIGTLLGNVRRNFWMGVRTPWTLASDAVWDATHRLAGRLLVIAGILGMILVISGVSPAYCLALLLVALLVPALYSLLLYKALEVDGEP